MLPTGIYLAGFRDRLAFVLFSPDATTTGLYDEGLRFLRERGFEVESSWWARPVASQIAELYEANRRGGQTAYQDLLVDWLFLYDYSLACIVRSCEGGEPHRSAVARLRELKGPSDPRGCRPSHLRWVLGAENKVMNLVHTSDSSAAAARESALFTSCKVPADVLSTSPLGSPPPDLAERASISALVVLCELKSRIWETQVLAPRVRKKVTRWLAVEREAALRRRKSRSDILMIEKAWRAQRELSACVDVPETARLALGIASSVSWDIHQLEPLLDSGRQAGGWLSGFEELILRCQFDYGPVPTFDGEP